MTKPHIHPDKFLIYHINHNNSLSHYCQALSKIIIIIQKNLYFYTFLTQPDIIRCDLTYNH